MEQNCPLGVSGTETPKRRSKSHYAISGLRKSGFRDLRVQGNTPLSILISEMPKYRNISTYCPFRISPIGISGLACTRDLPLGIPGAEIPNHLNLSTPRHFRVSYVGISRVVRTRVLTLWSPGCRNAKTLTGRHMYSTAGWSMHSHGSWDRRSRFLRYLRRLKRGRGIIACIPSFNFTVVTDLRSSERISFMHLARGRVSWVPNHRKVLTHPHAIISGFRGSGFRDLRVQENSHLDTPGAETLKTLNLPPR
jgi:hypothetical protein